MKTMGENLHANTNFIVAWEKHENNRNKGCKPHARSVPMVLEITFLNALKKQRNNGNKGYKPLAKVGSNHS